MNFLLLLVFIENIFVENIRKYMYGLTPQTHTDILQDLENVSNGGTSIIWQVRQTVHFSRFSTHYEVT